MYAGLIQRPTRGSVRARSMTRVPDGAADRVVHGIAGDRGGEQDDGGERDVEAARRRDRAGGEEQRVAGQERRHDQPGLGEDDHEEHSVDPPAVLARRVSRR